MSIFTPYFLCVLFLVAMYGFARLALYFSNISALRSIYKSGVYTPQTVHILFLASFGAKNIAIIRTPTKTTSRSPSIGKAFS